MTGYLIAGAALVHATVLPLAWKWQLGILRVALVVLAGSMIAAIIVAARLAPRSDDFIVSPADGQVIYVREIQPGRIPVAEKKGRAYPIRELRETQLADRGAVAVGISMNLSDVHVNRAPIGGRVALVRHVSGTFGSLRNPGMMFSNERVTTIIDAEGLQVALVQIASRLVRRIVTFVAEGDATHIGQRIGAIRFGSQVDLIVPAAAGVRLVVQAGDRVVAGRTVMAIITSRPAGPGLGRQDCHH